MGTESQGTLESECYHGWNYSCWNSGCAILIKLLSLAEQLLILYSPFDACAASSWHTFLSFPVPSALSAIWVTEEMEYSLEVEWENPPTNVDYYKLKFRSLVDVDEKQVMVPKSSDPKSRHIMTGEYFWLFHIGQGEVAQVICFDRSSDMILFSRVLLHLETGMRSAGSPSTAINFLYTVDNSFQDSFNSVLV